MHDGGALGQVSAQTHAVGISDAYAGRHDIVDHAGELVDGQYVHIGLRQARGGLVGNVHHVESAQGEILDRKRTVVGPHHVVKRAEDAIEVQAVRLGQTHAQQMQAQIGVGGVLDWLVEFGDGEHRNATHPAGIGALMGQIAEAVVRAGDFFGSFAELELRIPYVQGVAGGVHAGQAPTPRSALIGHLTLLQCEYCLFR